MTSNAPVNRANIAGDVLAIVEAVAGPGNARAAVNATVDWSANSEVSEVFSPVLDDNGEQLRSAASIVIESDDPTTAEGILEPATSTPSGKHRTSRC